jgi:hypothetical protein
MCDAFLVDALLHSNEQGGTLFPGSFEGNVNGDEVELAAA